MRACAVALLVLAAGAGRATAFRKRSKPGAKAADQSAPAADSAATTSAFLLDHDLGDGKGFVRRGEIEVGIFADTARTTASLRDQLSLSDDDITSLKTLAAASPASPYRLRLRSEATGQELISSARICDVAAAGFVDEIVLSLADTSGAVEVFEYRPVAAQLAGGCSSAEIPRAAAFDTTVHASLPEDADRLPVRISSAGGAAPVDVDGAADGKVAGKEGEEKKEQPQSLIRQYWYLLIPLVLMSLFGGGDDPRQQAPQGQARARGQGASQRQPAPQGSGGGAARPASSAGAGGPSRRSKLSR